MITMDNPDPVLPTLANLLPPPVIDLTVSSDTSLLHVPNGTSVSTTCALVNSEIITPSEILTPETFPEIFPRGTKRSKAQFRSYIARGCRHRNNGNQKKPGFSKIHHSSKTYIRANGPITVGKLNVSRMNKASKSNDPVYLPTNSRPTDNGNLMGAMATAMDDIPVEIGGHHFHHSTVKDALEVHAAASWNLVRQAMNHQRQKIQSQGQQLAI